MIKAPDMRPRPLDHLCAMGDPDDAALHADGLDWTYRDLDREVGAIATTLVQLGALPGDRVASWMGKTGLSCLLPLACARAGLVHVPINPMLKRGQAAHILADSGAALLIANQARLDSLAGGDRGDARLVGVEDWTARGDPLPASKADPDALAALFYTSGSTGRAKGVMLSHSNLWLGAVSVASYLGLSSDDRTLCVLPLAFDYGQNQLFSTWAAGGQAIGFDYLLPRDVVRAVARHAATVLAGVPPLWLQLSEADWSEGQGDSLRTLTNSGGHLPVTLVRRLRKLFPEARLHLMYGLTEAFRSTSLDPALVDSHPDSIGSAIPFAEVATVRADGSRAAPGEEGELVHAGPLVAGGYWRDPARTADRFRPAPAWSSYGGKAVWSGDWAMMGADGLFRFRGREDAMIKVSGNRVSPTEVEEVAIASGAVTSAMAIGIADERLGQAICLVAVAKGADSEARLRAHLLAELPAFMQPRKLVWRHSMPLSPNGKIDRAAVIAALQ